MLSRISLFLNIILILAVAYLYKIHFADDVAKEPAIVNSGTGNPLKIAYINIDTLDLKYQFILDQYKILEQEQKKADSRINREMKNAEERVRELQENAKWMTEQQAMDAQNEVMELERGITGLQTSLGNELAEKQAAVNEKYRTDLMNYLDELNTVNDYDYIMAYSAIGSILRAKDSYDLTPQVLSHLNESYEKSMPAGLKE